MSTKYTHVTILMLFDILLKELESLCGYVIDFYIEYIELCAQYFVQNTYKFILSFTDTYSEHSF